MLEPEQHKNNLVYFECSSMKELYDSLKNWQDIKRKSFLSLSIQKDGTNFCCIAVISPKELTQIVDYKEAMAKFQRRALRSIGVGYDFVHPAIPPEKVSAIQYKLKKCTTPEEVKAVFAEEL